MSWFYFYGVLTLSELELGQKAKIIEVQSCFESVSLLELGLQPGTEVQIQLIAPFGDPIAIEVMGAVIAIRKKEAALISVIKID